MRDRMISLLVYVWTVLDEVMNPNVEFRDGQFIVERAFAGEENFEMPQAGMNTLVKVEHEETVTMPRYLSKYGLQNCTFKIALDQNLIQALKVLDKLHLNTIEPVNVKGVSVVPRDVVAACAPQPQDLKEMSGSMVVGVYAKGIKNGREKWRNDVSEIFAAGGNGAFRYAGRCRADRIWSRHCCRIVCKRCLS